MIFMAVIRWVQADESHKQVKRFPQAKEEGPNEDDSEADLKAG